MLKGLAGTPLMKMFEKGLGGMGGKIDMNKLNQMTKQSGMKERLRKKMEQKKAALAQAEAQTPSSVPSPEIIPVNNNQYVFKIGNEVQEKSGLKPPSLVSASVPSAKASTAKPSPSGAPLASAKPSPPLSEAELIALFSKKGKSGKKTK
jgi:hypothetical protein